MEVIRVSYPNRGAKLALRDLSSESFDVYLTFPRTCRLSPFRVSLFKRRGDGFLPEQERVLRFCLSFGFDAATEYKFEELTRRSDRTGYLTSSKETRTATNKSGVSA